MLSLFSETLPARRVRLIRFVVGAICLLRAIEEYRVMTRVLNPQTMRFPVFEWLPAFTARQAAILLSIWFVAAVAFTIGWKTKIAGLILAACMGYTLFLDQQLYFSHLYLFCLIVLLLTLAYIGRPSETKSVWRWPILLLQIQLSIVYFFAAITKLNSVYLSGYMLGANLRPDLPRIFFNPNVLSAMAVASIVVELALAGGFWIKKLRKGAVVVGVLFHFTMVLSLTSRVAAQLALFAAACIAIYPLYFIQSEQDAVTLTTPDEQITASEMVESPS
jgi:hypothetical protein